MNPIKLIACSGVALVLSLSAAAALSDAEQQQLDQLIESAHDISRGERVGDANITARGSTMLQGAAACSFSRLLNADEYCDTMAVVFPQQGEGIDTIYYAMPEVIGYVNMDDWTEDVSGRSMRSGKATSKGRRRRASGSASRSCR